MNQTAQLHQMADELMAMIKAQDSLAAKSLKQKIMHSLNATGDDAVTLTISNREAIVLWMVVSNIDMTRIELIDRDHRSE
jgi:hypothetical protein